MGGRRKAREFALQMLYQSEASGTPMSDVAAAFWEDRDTPPDVRLFAERLATGTASSVLSIDAILAESLENWRLERLAIVDRNILRLAVYEFLHESDTPPVVIIDEAIEVARRFGGEDSWQFTNGILDAVRKKLEAAGALQR
ncbi:MAG TPA: transcription antitermination factor NusB [Candidatus Polarisedimenticolia bacterium]|nr:transcription antitermination factor NusB [Candidatus Polarisedimenticolia bacterium]